MLEEEVRCEGESVWEMNKCGQIERDRGNRNQIAKSIYIDPQFSQQIEVSRGMETSVLRKVSRKTTSTNVVVEEVSRNKAKTRKEARSIHHLSRSYRGSRNFLDRSTSYRRSIEIAIRKSLEA